MYKVYFYEMFEVSRLLVLMIVIVIIYVIYQTCKNGGVRFELFKTGNDGL